MVTGTLYFRKKTAIKHKEFIGIDVETYGNENLFYMGGVYDKNGYTPFYSRTALINYILQRRKNTIFVATNLQFDFSAIFFGTRYYKDFKILMRGSDFILCSLNTSDKYNIKFIDTLNYVPFPVAVMGDILGIPKLSTPQCLGRKPHNKEERLELEIYNKRDCEITYKFANFLQDGFKSLGCAMKLTIASTSMDYFLRNHLRFPIRKENIKDIDVNVFLKEAYAGGRTEVFKRATYKNLFCMDANALYPFTMRETRYPLPSSARYTKHPTIDVLSFTGVSKVLVDVSKDTMYPFLWKKVKGKLLFPTGVFTGYYTHEELKYAQSLGVKFILIESLYYKKSFYPFKDFVTTLYNLRLKYQKEKSPMELVVKTTMNSLYGKFFQKETAEFSFLDLTSSDTAVWEKFSNAEHVYVNHHQDIGYKSDKQECTSSFVIPIFSIYTTANARIHMHKLIVEHQAYYTDTDSIWVNHQIETSKELGKLKIEYDAKEVIFVKPKMYAVKLRNGKEKIKLKGVPKANREHFSLILDKKPVSYIKFSKTKSSIRANILPNTKQEIIKNISLEDNKRSWDGEFDENTPQTSRPIDLRGIEYV